MILNGSCITCSSETPDSPPANKEHVNGLYHDLCCEMRGQLEAGLNLNRWQSSKDNR